MKTFFKLLILLVLASYICFAVVHFSVSGDQTACNRINMAIMDSASANFVTADDVHRILQHEGVYPIGQQMDSINSAEIETKLKKDGFIKDAICYKTPGGTINLLITQRLPLLRIIADNGENYFIDDKGVPMAPRGYEADLAVVTGNVDKAFAAKDIVQIGKALRADAFWDNQIEQINITPSRHIEIVTRVGAHIIKVGTADHIKQKLHNLREFYTKVLPTVGWNRYKEISIEYENQIVCRK